MPYDYAFERKLIADDLRKFGERLSDPKLRLVMKDPIHGAVIVRCTIPLCRQKTRISERDWSQVKFAHPNTSLETLGTILSIHNHFSRELNFSVSGTLLVRNVGNNFFVICPNCGKPASFPYSNPHEWCHACGENIWFLQSQKAPMMRWNQAGSLWVLDLQFHNKIWDALTEMDENHVKRDKSKHVWLVSDAFSDRVAHLCIKFLPNFKWTKQEKAAAEERAKRFRKTASGKDLGPTATAALEILNALPSELLKRFYRLAVVELHPDKGGSTENFQKFQVSWKTYTEGRDE
jgi:hypothetical protein